MNRTLIALFLSAAAVVLAMLVPLAGNDALAVAVFLSGLVQNLATWVVLPLLFLQALMNTWELRRNMPRGFSLKAVLLVVVSALLAAMVGAIVVMLVNPARLAPVYQALPDMKIPAMEQVVGNLLPSGLLTTFSGVMTLAPALVVSALLIGAVIYEIRGQVRPVLDLGASLLQLASKLNQMVGAVLVFLLPIPLFAAVLSFRSVPDFAPYAALLTILGLSLAVLIVVILPLILILTRRIRHPGTYFRIAFVPMLFAGASGNTLSAYALWHRSSLSNNLHRPGQQWLMSVLAAFSRTGTAFVGSVCVFILVRSLSSLQINFPDTIFLVLLVALASLIAGAAPGHGILAVFGLVLWVFGKDYVENHTLLQPVLPLLVIACAVLDSAIQSFLLLLARFSSAGTEREAANRSNVFSDFQM